MRRILVIKLGALGDFVQAMGPAAAIRAHHAGAEITLLTSAQFAGLAAAAPYFDRVWIDARPSILHPLALWRLRDKLRGQNFARVYDLQTSDRSSFYFHLMRPDAPEWSGIARGASHPHANPARDAMHTIERQTEQLRDAGISSVPPPSLAWAASDVRHFALPRALRPAGAGRRPHRPEKRWPAANYAALARLIAARGAAPVVIGGASEAALGAEIARAAPGAIDLTGKTSFGDIVGLGGNAMHAVGNDTGPMHLVVAAGASATVLYSAASDPALTAPRGPRVTILRRADLAALAVEEVAATLPFG